jgi:haloacetate dehalogenase
MLRGFTARTIDVAGSSVALSVAGTGPPLLLLHGYPQTRACWHRVAPALAERFTVVAADLRGYGESAKPPGGPGHAEYSKRAMAADLVQAMAALGHTRFRVAGHDRGGRVTHRMALDHPQVVERAAVLDIVPTRTLFAGTDQAFATAYYHWFFLIQPDGLP